MFAGQGAQAVGMGRDLVAVSAAARRCFERADAVLERSLSSLCFAGPLSELTASANCQPAVYTMSVACAAALQERCPVEPGVCAGLSLGEFAALAVAAAFDFDTGLRLVAARAGLMDAACRATDGAMAAVIQASPALVEQVCADAGVDVANYNCPGQIVISGARERLATAMAALAAAGVSRVVPLQVAGAFHSRLMTAAAAELGTVLADVPIAVPRCPVVQNSVGELVDAPAAIRANLETQVAGSVRWEACVRAMLDRGVDAMIEFGPGRVLSGFMRRIAPDVPTWNVSTADDLERTVAAIAA